MKLEESCQQGVPIVPGLWVTSFDIKNGTGWSGCLAVHDKHRTFCKCQMCVPNHNASNFICRDVHTKWNTNRYLICQVKFVLEKSGACSGSCSGC